MVVDELRPTVAQFVAMKSMATRAPRKRVLSVRGDEFNGDALWVSAGRIQGEHWESNDDDDDSPRARVTVWRYDLPDDVFSEHDWARKYAAAIARTHGQSVSSLTAASSSRNPADRQWALEMIAGHHGWDNIDGYALELSASEMKRRWRGRL